MIRLAKFFQFDPGNPGDLQDFVGWLFDLCLWMFYILTSIVVVAAILKAGNGSLPPEPQWWLQLEDTISSWLRGGT